MRWLQEQTGKRSTTVPFGTELPQLTQLGAEAVVFGPGDIRVAHRMGEFVPVEELVACEATLRKALALPMAQMNPKVNTLLVRLMPLSLLVRTTGEPGRLSQPVAREVLAVDSRQPVSNVLTMEEIVTRSLGSQRFNMFLVGTLAALALALSAVGIYGMLSYLVAQRTQEIGVRVALGATRGNVVGLVLGQGMASVGAGALLGVGVAFGVSRLLTSLLYGLSA